MKKRIVRLTESDLERLVTRIIKEQELEAPADADKSDNPQDVDNFMEAMKKYFIEKYPRFSNKINTKNEKASVVAELAAMLGVDLAQMQRAKTIMKKKG